MTEVQEKIKEVDRHTAFNRLKKKVLLLNVGEELDITCNNDRAMEGNIQAWAYRQRKNDLFFKRATRGGKVFIIRIDKMPGS